MFSRLIASSGIFGLLVGSALVGPQAAQAAKIDLNKPQEIQLVACGSVEELDCVAEFGFLDAGGDYIPGQLAETVKSSPWVDGNGNSVQPAQTIWTAKVDGKDRRVSLNVPLQSPSYVIAKLASGDHLGASLRPSVHGSDLRNLKVRFVVRTSYLRPQNVQLVANESDFKQVKLAGGNAWTFEGKGTAVSGYSTDVQKKSQDWSAQADYDEITLHFIIHHADKDLSRGYWPAPCADKGYSVQAFNSNAAGEPRWDAANQSLDFAVPSPHLMASGEENVGFFKLWTTDAYMNCQWKGNTLATANSITVQIVDKNGSTQAATSRVVHGNGRLYVEATGFHYSAPTVKVKAVTKKRTLVCLKIKNPKITKTISGTSPKCPAGYKQK